MPLATAETASLPRPLDRNDYKTLTLSALGGALEFYDFVIFVFFAAVIGRQFFPSEIPEWLRQFQTFGIFAAGYLARPLGGIVMAHFGDRLGRKRMFSLSILLMALPTLVMGLLPSYAQIGILAPLLLLAMRILQGAAVGGEVPGAWVFVAEHAPPRAVGYFCGVLTSGLTLGILLGSLMATLLNAVLGSAAVADWGWRLGFLVGGVFGLLSVYLRRWLHETPIFMEMQERQALAHELPLKRVLRAHLPEVLLSGLLTWLLSGAIVVVMLMTPSLLQSLYAFEPTQTLAANSLAIICLSLGCILVGRLCDRFGAGRVLSVGSVLLALTTWVFYTQVPADHEALFWLYAPLGLCVGVVSVVPYVMVSVFPSEVRFSGISFSYNLSYALFGGLTPMVVALLLKWHSLGPAWYLLGLCVLGLVLGLWLIRQRR